LYTRLLPALGVATLIGSFIEADQRGLLFRSDDMALLAEDAALAVPSQGLEMYLGGREARGGSPRGRNFIGRPPGSRLVPGNASNLNEGNGVSPAPGGSRTILDQPAREQLASPTLASAATAPSAATSPGSGSFGPNFPDSPIGLIAVGTNTPGPVVPAVPEPASWLLMIVGVGWLGLALRRRKRFNPWESATPVSAG
jgi:hypothetical protein